MLSLALRWPYHREKHIFFPSQFLRQKTFFFFFSPPPGQPHLLLQLQLRSLRPRQRARGDVGPAQLGAVRGVQRVVLAGGGGGKSGDISFFVRIEMFESGIFSPGPPAWPLRGEPRVGQPRGELPRVPDQANCSKVRIFFSSKNSIFYLGNNFVLSRNQAQLEAGRGRPLRVHVLPRWGGDHRARLSGKVYITGNRDRREHVRKYDFSVPSWNTFLCCLFWFINFFFA